MKLKLYSLGVAVAMLAASGAFFAYEKAFADSIGMGDTTSPTNHAAMWNNNGTPDEAGKTPLDFGWEAWNGDVRVLSDVGEANASMVTRFRTTDKYVGETFPHLLLHFQNTKVNHFAFPLADITPGKTYEVKILFHRHENDNRYAGFGVNSRPNRTGVNYGEVTHPTPAGAWETARFYFTATENDDNAYYLTFFQPKGTLRLLAIGDIQVSEADPFSLENASEQNPVDLTWKYISNPSFEASHSDDNGQYILDWNNSGMQKQQNDDFPRHGIIYVEKWTSSANNVPNISISQTLRNLPGGKYRLSAVAQNVKQNSDAAVSGAYIFAGDATTEVSAPGDYSVTFDMPSTGSGDINIGFRTVNAVGNYVGVDNMRLEYIGAASAEVLTLDVTVVDFKNNPVADANVALNVTDQKAVTDAEGKASISFTYSGTENPVVTVTKEGFAAYTSAINWGGSYTHVEKIQLREAQPLEGNLLSNALHGTIGGYPAGWTDYTRAGTARDHRGMATLRNNIGKEEGTNPEMLMLRWDDAWSGISDAEARADHDRYYTLPVEIPQTGVYAFKMKCVEWNNWNTQANENSQMPDKSAIRVSFTDAPGYDYTQIQSHVFDMNTDNRGAVDDSKKTSIEWIDCEARYFLTAGTHYLSFVGSHALYPIRDLSLTLDADNTPTELPTSDGIRADVNMENDTPLGGWLMTNDPEVEAEYIFVPDNDIDRIRTYGPWRERFITQNGTLYAYQIKDGVHCALLTQHTVINAPEFKDEHISFSGLSVAEADITPKASFSHPEYMGVYYKFVPASLTSANVEYDDEGRGDFTLLKESEIEFTENGVLSLYPYVYGVEGAERSFEIRLTTDTVKAIEASADDGLIYDLQGHRLEDEPIHGLFIRAGRLILK